MTEPGTSVYVIALSGHSGAGKSTAIQHLASRLGSAVVLGIDDYEATSTYPEAIQWLAEGADPNAFQTPQLVEDVRALRSGAAITPPDAHEPVQPASFLIVEEPFGRGREQMRGMIDFVAYIDVPLEIALARKILRRNAFLPWEQDPGVFMAHLQEFLTWYLKVGRAFYLATRDGVLASCDLVVDGTLPPEQVAEAIYAAVRARRLRGE
jgi:uridine kinase